MTVLVDGWLIVRSLSHQLTGVGVVDHWLISPKLVGAEGVQK